MEQLLNKFEECLKTWSDLPQYVYTNKYKEAFVDFAKGRVEIGKEPNNLVIMTLHHETSGRKPYFEFDRDITYQCEYEDGEFEILSGTDYDIFSEAIKYEDSHGCLFNIFEVNENYEEVRTIF